MNEAWADTTSESGPVREARRASSPPLRQMRPDEIRLNPSKVISLLRWDGYGLESSYFNTKHFPDPEPQAEPEEERGKKQREGSAGVGKPYAGERPEV